MSPAAYGIFRVTHTWKKSASNLGKLRRRINKKVFVQVVSSRVTYSLLHCPVNNRCCGRSPSMPLCLSTPREKTNHSRGRQANHVKQRDTIVIVQIRFRNCRFYQTEMEKERCIIGNDRTIIIRFFSLSCEKNRFRVSRNGNTTFQRFPRIKIFLVLGHAIKRKKLLKLFDFLSFACRAKLAQHRCCVAPVES